MRLLTTNVIVALISGLSIPCAAQNLKAGGAQYIVFSGNITGSVTYPPKYKCPTFTKTHSATNLYVGKNGPWDNNDFFFDLSHRASDTTASIGFTNDYIYNLEFTSASYDCMKDGKPCGFIAYDPDYVANTHIDLDKTKIVKAQVEGKPGYTVSGDAKALAAKGTVNGVDIDDDCLEAGSNWKDFLWNATTPVTYSLSFSNNSASIKITTTNANGEMTLSFTGPRNETASSLKNAPIALDASSDTPQFTYVNGSEIHFAKSRGTWTASATQSPSDDSSSDSPGSSDSPSSSSTGSGPSSSSDDDDSPSSSKPADNAAAGINSGLTATLISALGLAAVLAFA